MRFILFCILFFSASLLQVSFFPHLRFAGFSLSTVLFLLCILSLVGQRNLRRNIEAAIAGGIFLDVFSSSFFGQWVLILLFVTLFLHFLIRKYARIPILQTI